MPQQATSALFQEGTLRLGFPTLMEYIFSLENTNRNFYEII